MRTKKDGPVKYIHDILTDAQVKLICKEMERAFGLALPEQTKGHSLDMEWTVRFMAVSSRIKERRGALGLSIQKIARLLKVPQYRLKAIEAGHRREILPEVLDAYLDLLRLKPWFGKWRKANPGMKRFLSSH